MQSLIELTRFQLNDTNNKDQFVELQSSVNDWLKTKEGFFYRTLVEESDNTFLDIVHWQSLEAAESASKEFERQAFAEPFMALINLETISMNHVPALSEIGYDGSV